MFAALKLIETFRAKGQPLTGGVFRVCWDAAADDGVRLRVTSNRKVNVRKGNRPPRSLFGINAASYELWRGDAAGGGTFSLRTLEDAIDVIRRRDADAARPMTIEQAGPMFFEFAPNTPPPLATWDTGLWTEYESDRIFRELNEPTILVGNPRDFRQGDYVEVATRRPGFSAVITSVDYAARTITISHDEPPAPTPPRAAPADPSPKSRVPRHVRERQPRLDGRRSR